MPKIFISYRREDSAYAAQDIYKELCNSFGSDSVVFDIDSIPLGIDFRKYINDQVSQCDVLLAVIGDRWEEILSQKADTPNDYVRIEIQAALERDIPVVPVLLDKATIPAEKNLPSELAPLAYRNAAEVRAGKDFDVHLSRLLSELESLSDINSTKKVAGEKPSKGKKTRAPSSKPQRSKAPWIISAAIVCVLLVVIIILNKPTIFRESVQQEAPKKINQSLIGLKDRPEEVPPPAQQLPEPQTPTPQTIKLFVTVKPQGADVKIMNIKPPFVQGMSLEPGSYLLQADAEGYVTKKLWVELTMGPERRVEMVLLKSAQKKEPPKKVSDSPSLTRVVEPWKPPMDREGTVPSSTSKTFTNSLNMTFVYIPPGIFTMGSPKNEPGHDDDEQQHQVTLTQGFYLQTTEVTQGQWRAVMDSNPSNFSKCGDNCPVEKVSWEDTQQFITKLSQKESGRGYRLPTEAEWEYAARAGSTAAFANGGITETQCGHDSNLDALGWYCGNSSVNYENCYDSSGYGGPKCAGTHPVGQKRPNDWGLYDMHGNVWEWCADWYAKSTEGGTDLKGPSSGSHRVLRGGSWINVAWYCRSAYRFRARPGLRYSYLGFRLALSPGQQGEPGQ